jgi:TolB-like protein
MTALETTLLGRFALRIAGRPLAVGGPKQQALFAYLVFRAGQPVGRSELASLLWGDRFDPQARQSLRQALTRLRRVLDDSGADVLIVDHDEVSIPVGSVASDLERFRQGAQSAHLAERRAAAKAYATLLEGLVVRQAEFETWLTDARRTLAATAASLFDGLTSELARPGVTNDALTLADRWIALDPFNEPAHRRAIELCLVAGDRAGAVKRYRALEASLQEELGVQPAPETAALLDRLRTDEAPDASAPQPGNGKRERPGIAVLPFQSLSPDPDHEYFSDGLTEDIIFALSHWNTFFVIARSSTGRYKGQSPDVRQVARHLGVDYVLEGSVRRLADRVRVNVQLNDGLVGGHVWTARFDRQLDDFFKLQDEITELVAAKVEPEFAKAEQRKAAQKPPSSLDAWENYQRGIASLNELTEEGNLRAQDHFRHALKLDPQDSRIHSGMAYCLFRYSYDGFSKAPVRASQDALAHAKRAIELDDGDAQAHETLAILLIHAGEAEDAIAEARRAVEINPNFAHAHIPLGNSLSLVGRPDEGIPFLERAIQLNPDDVRSHIYLSLLADAHLNNRDYRNAAHWAGKAIERSRDFPHPYMTLASAMGHMGEIEVGAEALARCQRLHPDYLKLHPLLEAYKNPSDRMHYLEGLTAAGMKLSDT